jgi:hypothetical protein
VITRSFQILVDRKTLDSFARALKGALRVEATLGVRRILEVGVKTLREMEKSVGHEFLAPRWKYTTPQVHADGTVDGEIYNEAESLTMYMKSGGDPDDRSIDGRYPFQGKDLLNWLEYGTKPHVIAPHSGKELVFPWSPDHDPKDGRAKESDFLGTGFDKNGSFRAQFGLSDDSEIETETVRTPWVNHPGFAAFGFLEATRKVLESRLSTEATLIGRRIATQIV